MPRIPGGDPWPPEGLHTPPAPPEPAAPAPTPMPAATEQQALRRGLPRIPGGEPWPEIEFAHLVVTEEPATAAPEPPAVAAAPVHYTDITLRRGLPRIPGGAPWPEVATAQVESAPGPEVSPVVEAPSPVVEKPAEEKPAAPRRERPAWFAKAIGAGVGLMVLLAVAILAARAVVAGVAADFIARYPGVAPTPDNTPVGLPAWLGWSHFFNFFLMVMIIRTGLQIRGERKPPAYFTSKSGKKVSLTIWFHTSMDLLWLLNGVVFLVLLFATGQWMRIVPTSVDVFPNMASAALQYLAMDWPAENGWIHYNALQQVAYFVTVFVAAPLAAATGFRMSNWWPNAWTFFPVELARKIHFPTMVYFVLFIIGHVFLVFATGFRKNLGHMFAASPDGGWLGVGLFLVSLLVTAGAVFAAKPLVLAQLARPFGEVTNR
ncbi:cytochrome b/b6 domain-containing protein [Corynebacterium hindlerae]|uniref:cytochrome b/b6 domain-containing protein n=1 Tax=Corynebacterium hindlerae TaxID=699041 RepID=UPI001FCB72FE|nr:cytochrome b/b6 domain-containing protein [Corynebacterium hindlerae]